MILTFSPSAYIIVLKWGECYWPPYKHPAHGHSTTAEGGCLCGLESEAISEGNEDYVWRDARHHNRPAGPDLDTPDHGCPENSMPSYRASLSQATYDDIAGSPYIYIKLFFL